MEATLKGEITFFSETKGDKIKFKTHKRSLVEIGSKPTCDIRIVGADDVHMKILLDEASGKVKKEERNFQFSKPQSPAYFFLPVKTGSSDKFIR